MNCPYCNQPILDGARFCGNCGKPVPAAPVTAESGAVRLCPNCGEKVPAGKAFCPNCGERMSQPAARDIEPQPAARDVGATPAARDVGPRPAGGSGGNKRGPLIAVVAVVLVLALAVGAFALFSAGGSVAKKFISLHEEMLIKPLLAQVEQALDSCGTGSFSSDLTLTGKVGGNDEINFILKNSAITLKLEAEKDTVTANAGLTLMGSPVMSGDVTYDKGVLGFRLPEADPTYYTMNLSDVLYTLTGEDVDLEGARLPELSGKEWASLVTTYWQVVNTVVTKENVELKKNQSISLRNLGGSCEGTSYTFTPTAADIEAMLKVLADHLEKDAALRGLIARAVSPAVLNAAVGDEMFSEKSFEDELGDVLRDAADTIRSNAGRWGRDVESAGFQWTLSVEGKELRKLCIGVKDDREAFLMERKGTEAEGEVFTSAGGAATRMEYTRKENRYTGKASFSVPDAPDTLEMEFDLDEGKKSVLGMNYGSYDFDIEGVEIALEVAADGKNGADHTITVRGIEAITGGEFDRMELTLNATDKGTAARPSGPSRDISDYSEDELFELLEALADALGESVGAGLLDQLYG